MQFKSIERGSDNVVWQLVNSLLTTASTALTHGSVE